MRNRARTNARPVSKTPTPTKAQATRQNVLSQTADDLPSSKSLIEVIFLKNYGNLSQGIIMLPITKEGGKVGI